MLSAWSAEIFARTKRLPRSAAEATRTILGGGRRAAKAAPATTAAKWRAFFDTMKKGAVNG